MKNFWKDLQSKNQPITALAPMEEVTDVVFRTLVATLGRPDVFFTEFTSVEGINSIGQAKVIHRLQYQSSEQPIVAQLWGVTPHHYTYAAQLAVQLGFAGLDINMGCPVAKVIKKGACSALIKNPSLAKTLVEAAREGLNDTIPLSIKTRLGFHAIQTEEWIGFLLQECKPEALTVHIRTVKELSLSEPRYEEIKKIVDLRNRYSPQTILLINGNLGSLKEIYDLTTQYSVDGGMVGRGIFHNPWLFSGRKSDNITLTERLNALLLHTHNFVTTWGEEKNFSILKRFYKIYIQGFSGASMLRTQLMECKNEKEVQSVVFQFANIHSISL